MNRKFALCILSILAITANAFFINSALAEKFSGRDDKNSLLTPAATLLIEDFTAPPSTAITAAGWAAHSAGGTNPIATSAPSLTLAGYPSSGVGNAVTLATTGEDDNRSFAPQTSGSVYAAFMVNTSDAAIDPVGGYFFHLGPDPIGTTFRARVFIKKDASNNIAFGISKAATAAADVAFTPFSYSLNTTYLVVVKYTIVAGATNDTVALFVSTNVPATEPAPTVSATDIATQSDINPGTVALRQGTASTSPTSRVDGIRVGTSWESVTQAVIPADAPVDFNGDGRSDFAVIRNVGGANGQLRWFYNTSGTGEPTAAFDWGVQGDIAIPEDYDGDGRDDIAVWRAAPNSDLPSFFYILRSSDNTVQTENFGRPGDDPRVVGDYDGDGKADVAVFRDTAEAIWFYRGTLNNPQGNITYVPWGTTNDRVAPGDYDGDGKFDFVITRGDGDAKRYWMLQTTAGFATLTFGLTGDLNVPGDYDGDGKTDLAVVRSEGLNRVWYYQPSSGGAYQQIVFGLGTTDLPAQGDYDGDGKTDAAVWRNDGTFWVRNSSNGAASNFTLGSSGDIPAASYNTY